MNNSPFSQFFDFSDSNVVVTGASGGIGAEIARHFARAGATVFVHYRSNKEGADAVQQEIGDTGGRAITVSADVSTKEGVTEMFGEITSHTDRLDVLVNNAGSYPQSSILEMEEEEWDAVINSSLRSTFLCTQAAAAIMRKNNAGSIVNIASIEAESPAAMHSHYCSAKSGVLMFTRTAANELGKYNIRSNAVLPGLIWREGIEGQWPEGVNAWKESAPLGRLGLASDVAAACLFLGSPAAGWITGAELRVDGGIMCSNIF